MAESKPREGHFISRRQFVNAVAGAGTLLPFTGLSKGFLGQSLIKTNRPICLFL